MKLNVFTICYNGMPFIRRHLTGLVISGLDFQWTIVHGRARPNDCTHWRKGDIPEGEDGTLAYLRHLASERDNVHLIEAPEWHSKLAMCNAALATFSERGLLLQMDADEFWTGEQLALMPILFAMYPDADCAKFMARVWLGRTRFVCTDGAWGNRDYEWLRLWKWEPGRLFNTHEPPELGGQKYFVLKSHTAMLGLVFDHYAYLYRHQIEFKRKYYGERWDVEAWDKLQTLSGPVELHGLLPWVDSPVMSHETTR